MGQPYSRPADPHRPPGRHHLPHLSDAWSQTAFDPNDTVGETDNAWALAREPGSSASAEEKRAALLALAHTNTPTISHVDALGRVFRKSSPHPVVS